MLTVDDITSGMAIEAADSENTKFSARLSEMPEMVARLNAIEADNASTLASRWIRAEQQYRHQVREAMQAGTPFSAMAAHADQLRECRRELQEAFGLVSSPGKGSGMSTEQTAASYDAAQSDPRRPGRPARDGQAAVGHVHLRVTVARKGTWVRAARPKKLAEWMTEHLDRAAGQ